MVTLAAAQTARDYELRRGGLANSGIVEAIAPVIGQRDTYAVVTRERTTATATDAYRGLAPSWHVALATVTGEPAPRVGGERLAAGELTAEEPAPGSRVQSSGRRRSAPPQRRRAPISQPGRLPSAGARTAGAVTSTARTRE